MQINVQFPKKMLQAYMVYCKPLCQELQIPQTALDILLFLANNPTMTTARDIVEVRGIKANLVSVNVDKLVREGFLERRPDLKDRRKIHLACTEKAQPFITRGREVQAAFFERLFREIGEDERNAFQKALVSLNRNLDQIIKEA